MMRARTTTPIHSIFVFFKSRDFVPLLLLFFFMVHQYHYTCTPGTPTHPWLPPNRTCTFDQILTNAHGHSFNNTINRIIPTEYSDDQQPVAHTAYPVHHVNIRGHCAHREHLHATVNMCTIVHMAGIVRMWAHADAVRMLTVRTVWTIVRHAYWLPSLSSSSSLIATHISVSVPSGTSAIGVVTPAPCP